MSFSVFSHNGQICNGEPSLSVTNIEFAYGFGVYENIRVSKGTIHFLTEHCQRLMQSAKLINLEHSYTAKQIAGFVQELCENIENDAYNLKILLIGGKTPNNTELFILPLAPRFPNRKLYKSGAKAITYQYERLVPQAKTLNMLGSYLAYREAKKHNAYDALLIDNDGYVLEGTRTNLFAISGTELITAPAETVLEGVTRSNVINVAKRHGYGLREQLFKPEDLFTFDGVFLTSTSSKIMPLQQIDDVVLPPIPENLKKLMKFFGDFLSARDS